MPVGLVPAFRVSAAEFVRNFGVWRERATSSPVTITNHGRDTHVLVSSGTYSVIAQDNMSPTTCDDAYASMNAFFDKVRDCVIIIDHDLVVQRANAAACDFLKMSAATIETAPLAQTLPRLDESLALRHIIRTLTTGERSSTDVPSITRPGVWLHIETFPINEGAAIFFRDITADVESNRGADVKQIIIEAIGLHGNVGHARISIRETIETVDAVFCDMMNLREEVLRRVKFSTMIVQRKRAAFHDALETVFLRQGPVCLDTCLLSNSGRELPVRLSIVELGGKFATEGAIIVVTRRYDTASD
jgi:PAS domain-containing protein